MLVLGVQQTDSTIFMCTYTYINYYKIFNVVPCATQ